MLDAYRAQRNAGAARLIATLGPIKIVWFTDPVLVRIRPTKIMSFDYNKGSLVTPLDGAAAWCQLHVVSTMPV